jgi:hypothetical protein
VGGRGRPEDGFIRVRRNVHVVELREIDAVENDRAPVGAIEPGDEIERRSTPDRPSPRRSRQGEVEIDAGQDGALPGPGTSWRAANREHAAERTQIAWSARSR